MHTLSPLKSWTRVEASSVQACFQELFTAWGLPEMMRFDNGKPWANPHTRVPTCLALWLVGLGIRPVFGRPRRSTDNAVVERSHGVLNNWVEPAQCANLNALQHSLDQFVHLQRAVYPSCAGHSRFDAHPEIHVPLRCYDRSPEEALWEPQRVMDYVSSFRFTRTVEKNGRVTHFTREYAVGRRYAHQQVTVYLDPKTHEWVTEDDKGESIKRFPADQLNYLTLATMAMVYR